MADVKKFIDAAIDIEFIELFNKRDKDYD